MRKKTYRIALGGVLAALAAVFMMLGGVFPFAQIVGPCMACACVMVFHVECGTKWSFIMYLAVCGVSLLISPDLESVLLFIAFLGWYPILKEKLEDKIKKEKLVWILKVISLDVCVGLLYYLLLNVFLMPSLNEEFSDYTSFMLILIIVMANVAFVLMDICLTRLSYFYVFRLRKKLTRN